ncbi:type 1 glutamine amidotransferase domain-containing protein [Fulvitalea axinellae]
MRNLFKYTLAVFLFSALWSCQSGKSTKNSEKETIAAKAKSVLFVLSSNDQMGDTDKKTGVWLEEFATPYYLLKDNNINITIVSPKGGQIPFDPGSLAEGAATEATKRYEQDAELKKLLANTGTLTSVKAGDFDAVFYPGGHGLLWDLTTDKNSIALLEDFFNAGKPVASVCHGPAAFANAKAKNGQPIVSGKKVTGFSNTEEEAIQLTGTVPFLLENKLKENGGQYSRTDDWKSYAQVDGNLITGQNPTSTPAVAEALLKALK